MTTPQAPASGAPITVWLGYYANCPERCSGCRCAADELRRRTPKAAA